MCTQDELSHFRRNYSPVLLKFNLEKISGCKKTDWNDKLTSFYFAGIVPFLLILIYIFYPHSVVYAHISKKRTPQTPPAKRIIHKINPKNLPLNVQEQNLYSNNQIILSQASILKIGKPVIMPVYTALYKYYNQTEIGYIQIRNESQNSIICQIETSIDTIGYTNFDRITISGLTEVAVPIRISFSKTALKMNGSHFRCLDLKLSFSIGSKKQEIVKQIPFKLISRNKLPLSTDQPEIATFITVGDTFVHNFSKMIKKNRKNTLVYPQNILYVYELFSCLDQNGFNIQPNAIKSEAEHSLQIQFPSETIHKKQGTQLDFVVLLAALLENQQIATAFIHLQENFLLLFETGIASYQKYKLCCDEKLLVHFNDRLWIPLLLHPYSNSFFAAWRRGAEAIQSLPNLQQSVRIVREMWEIFPPIATTQDFVRFNMKLNPGKPDYILFFTHCISNISNLNFQANISPADMNIRNKLALAYYSLNNKKLAETHFKQLLAIDSTNCIVLNNFGNFLFSEGKKDSARSLYERALFYAGNANREQIFFNYRLVMSDKGQQFLNHPVYDETGHLQFQNQLFKEQFEELSVKNKKRQLKITDFLIWVE